MGWVSLPGEKNIPMVVSLKPKSEFLCQDAQDVLGDFPLFFSELPSETIKFGWLS